MAIADALGPDPLIFRRFRVGGTTRLAGTSCAEPLLVATSSPLNRRVRFVANAADGRLSAWCCSFCSLAPDRAAAQDAATAAPDASQARKRPFRACRRQANACTAPPTRRRAWRS